MLTSEFLYEVGVELYRKIVDDFTPPPDVIQRLRQYRNEETGLARDSYEFWFGEYERLKGMGQIVCPDSGFNCFYVSVGTKANVDAEIDWWGALGKAAVEASHRNYIEGLSHDPITGENNRLNVGIGHPWLQFNSAQGADCVEITIVPRGAGNEFGSAYTTMVPADGVKGVRKWVVDRTAEAEEGGKVCPPNIIGVGIGGHSGVTSNLAWDAAALRPVGSRHPVDWVARLEDDLLDDINSLGMGPMGLPGKTVALDVHVEIAWSHLVVLPVALQIQCTKASRATARIYSDSRIEYDYFPRYWFNDLRRTTREYKTLAAAAGAV